MNALGYDPLQVRTLFFTHCHHDHYLGLSALLFYRAMKPNAGPLTIVGPPDDLPVVVRLAQEFLQTDRFEPLQQHLELIPLEPGETWQDERYQIQTIRALHPVTAVCGRLTDKHSGAVIAFSGDTAPNAELAGLARGADMLIHDLRVTMQTLGWRKNPQRYLPLQDDISSVAYWYQTLPTTPFPELPNADGLEII